jgi:hypothetical protein
VIEFGSVQPWLEVLELRLITLKRHYALQVFLVFVADNAGRIGSASALATTHLWIASTPVELLPNHRTPKFLRGSVGT